jgi:hypothetical protein
MCDFEGTEGMGMEPAICCLCGQEILSSPASTLDELSMDHVPPRQFYPKELRRTQELNLWVVPTHRRCNESYRKDEEYFYHAMAAVVKTNNGTMGQTVFSDLARRKHRPQTPAMMRNILKTFKTVTDGGIQLPHNVVQFSVDQIRCERVILKIAQGLLFKDLGYFVPVENCKDIRFCVTESDVPEFYALSWQGAEQKTVEPSVFSFKRLEFDGMQLISMLFWEAFMFCCVFENVSAETSPPVAIA